RFSRDWSSDVCSSDLMHLDVPECVAGHPKDISRCSLDRREALAVNTLEEAASASPAGVELMDLNDLICPGATCYPVIGSVLVYRSEERRVGKGGVVRV